MLGAPLPPLWGKVGLGGAAAPCRTSAHEAGSAAAPLGPVAAVLAGGGLTLLVTLSWAGLFPVMRRVHRFTDLSAAPLSDVTMPSAPRDS
jgi:hypothetical protein